MPSSLLRARRLRIRVSAYSVHLLTPDLLITFSSITVNTLNSLEQSARVLLTGRAPLFHDTVSLVLSSLVHRYT
jgi:hypothetical protein